MERDDRLFAVIGSCVAIGTAVVVWLVGFTPLRPPDADEQASAPVVSAAQPAAEVVPTPDHEPVVVPAVHRPDLVDDRDGFVRSSVRRMTRHPEVLRWLVTDDLSNRIVEIVDAVADGRVPRAEAAVVATDGPFLVREHRGGFVLAAGTSRRFDVLVAALTSIDPADAASLLAEVAPELEAAWTERGGPGWFEEQLQAAVDHLLAVRVPVGPLEVERRSRYYEFADDDLRMASPVQKALLRTGGRNARAIQAWLDALRFEMQWPSRPEEVTVLVAEATPEDVDGVSESPGEVAPTAVEGVAAGAR